MVRSWRLFWISLWVLLIGTIFTRNVIKYKKEKISWKLGKSFLDTLVIVISALFIPSFLISLDAVWIGSFFENRWIKLLVSLFCGILLGVFGTYAMELIVLMGIFSVDSKTGPVEGIIKRWNDVVKEEMTGEPIAA